MTNLGEMTGSRWTRRLGGQGGGNPDETSSQKTDHTDLAPLGSPAPGHRVGRVNELCGENDAGQSPQRRAKKTRADNDAVSTVNR